MVKVAYVLSLFVVLSPLASGLRLFPGAALGSGNITGSIADHAWGMDRTLSFSTQQTISLGGRRCELEEQANC